MGRKSKSALTYQTLLSYRLASLEVKDSVKREELILEIWGECNYWIVRSFDVFFTKAKKEFPQKQFRTIKGFIHRLK